MGTTVEVLEEAVAVKPKRCTKGLSPRVCLLPECREVFTPTWRHQVFHLPACREAFYNPLDVEAADGPERIRTILGKLEYDHPFFRAAQKAINSKQAVRGNKSAKRKAKL